MREGVEQCSDTACQQNVSMAVTNHGILQRQVLSYRARKTEVSLQVKMTGHQQQGLPARRTSSCQAEPQHTAAANRSRQCQAGVKQTAPNASQQNVSMMVTDPSKRQPQMRQRAASVRWV
jgi:hypothetical protein